MPATRALKVLVVDDHVGIRIGIASLINAEHPRMSAVGSAANGAEALAKAYALKPDVVVLDVNLDGEDGLALIPALLRAASCEVVVLTSLSDAHVAMHAQHMGARACIHKAAPASELLLVIRDCRVENAIAFDSTPASAGVAQSHAARSKHP